MALPVEAVRVVEKRRAALVAVLNIVVTFMVSREKYVLKKKVTGSPEMLLTAK